MTCRRAALYLTRIYDFPIHINNHAILVAFRIYLGREVPRHRDAEAQEAFERVWFRLIARLSGAAWHRSEQVIEELRATSIPNLLRNAGV